MKNESGKMTIQIHPDQYIEFYLYLRLKNQTDSEGSIVSCFYFSDSKKTLRRALGRQFVWPKRFFIDGMPAPRSMPDPLFDELYHKYNTLINELRAKAEHAKQNGYKLKESQLDFLEPQPTVDLKPSELLTIRIKKDLEERKIRASTAGTYGSVVNRLQRMEQSGIDFSAHAFETWAKENGLKANSLELSKMILKKYLKNSAYEPLVKHIKSKTRRVVRPIFNKLQYEALYQYLPHLKSHNHVLIRMFVFACETSLRISDVRLAERSWLQTDNSLHFYPLKNGKKRNKPYRCKLSRRAMEMIEKEGEKLFKHSRNHTTDQEQLRKIGVLVGINDLQFHDSRRYFATEFYKQRNDPRALAVVMDVSIETAMGYVQGYEGEFDSYFD